MSSHVYETSILTEHQFELDNIILPALPSPYISIWRGHLGAIVYPKYLREVIAYSTGEEDTRYH